MKKQIDKVLVANRGEIAVRIIRGCKDLGIRTVAVFSSADRNSPHVLMADEAYMIGPPQSRESYLNIGNILDAASRSHADAIHPGYGFLSENADFAEAVQGAGIIFIGPQPHSIRVMGNKTAARSLVQQFNVPTVPGTPDSVTSLDEVENFSQEHDFPVLIKAAAGGGGKGMRIVHSATELAPSYASARSEAMSAFGDDRIYVEKYLEKPRHVEFQILADKYGNTIHLGERECSVQRRHQKVVEETPSVLLDEELRSRMGETAVNAAKACNYENAGTIEFLIDADRNFYFLEMNTRLQVEHPITELRTGIDLVEQQLRIAMGEQLSMTQNEVTFRGHAIECRISAEDPHNGFLPSTGIIKHLHPAGGIGVRDDRGISEGGEVSVYYDPMIAKLVVWGQDRHQAIRRMLRALLEYEILGVKTNIPVCKFVLSHERFQSGEYDTHFLANYFSSDVLPKPSDSIHKAAVVIAAMAKMEQGKPQLQDLNANNTNGLWKSMRLRSFQGDL